MVSNAAMLQQAQRAPQVQASQPPVEVQAYAHASQHHPHTYTPTPTHPHFDALLPATEQRLRTAGRRAPPSPLQQTVNSPRSPRTEEPRSPRERLDALLEEEQSFAHSPRALHASHAVHPAAARNSPLVET